MCCIGYYYVESGEYDSKNNTIRPALFDFGNKYCTFTKFKMIGSMRLSFDFSKFINIREINFSQYDSGYRIYSRNNNITKISIKKEYSDRFSSNSDNKLAILDLGADIKITLSASYMYEYHYKVGTFYCRAVTAPALPVTSGYFYNNSSSYFGKDATGAKILYVPANSTGYDEGLWKSELIDKCGFTLSKTL